MFVSKQQLRKRAKDKWKERKKNKIKEIKETQKKISHSNNIFVWKKLFRTWMETTTASKAAQHQKTFLQLFHSLKHHVTFWNKKWSYDLNMTPRIVDGAKNSYSNLIHFSFNRFLQEIMTLTRAAYNLLQAHKGTIPYTPHNYFLKKHSLFWHKKPDYGSLNVPVTKLKCA